MTFDIPFIRALTSNAFKWSISEKAYVESHLCLYQTLLATESPEEFLMNFEIMKCSMTFPLVDYVSIFSVGLGENFLLPSVFNGCNKLEEVLPHLTMAPVLVKLIDNFDVFDSVIKTSAFPRLLLSVRSVYKSSSIMHKLVELVLAHMFKKFPDLYKMNFNFTKRHGRRF